ncbi:violacein biosynthesis protein VioB [Calothrix sp. NIES-4071]|nr:violacein biosynthesis protein VioB [Calothrix sp. NIES-4071]BAZ56900.1 violacein biosynthesis protein VioB [Calothrix sp. NIES-4105]
MSVLDFPRIHFSGWCRFHKPTGNQNKAGNIDLTTNEVYFNEQKIDHSVKSEDFYRHYCNLGIKYNSQGQEDSEGVFNQAAGRDFEGNSRVSWNAKIVSTQTEFGVINTNDPLIGKSVDLWGHYNEYLGTTSNEAKVVELDSASNWTTHIYGGHFTLGRDGDSVNSGYLLNANIPDIQHARWYKNNHILNFPEHWNSEEIKKAVVYQFILEKDDADFYLNDERLNSETLAAFRNALECETAKGIVVQYCLFNANEPVRPNTPTFYSLVGTVGIWYGDRELATYPAGRVIFPLQSVQNQKFVEGWGLLSIQLFQKHFSLNMPIAVPINGIQGISKPPVSEHGEFHVLHDLYLFCQGIQEPLALIPAETFQKASYYKVSGIFDCNYLMEMSDEILNKIAQSPIYIATKDENGNFISLLQEKEVIIQANNANVYLEYPSHEKKVFFDECVEVRSFVRGVPSTVKNIQLYQVYNPANFPFKVMEMKQEKLPSNKDRKICLVKFGTPEVNNEFQTELKFDTNEEGRAKLTLRGLNSGGGRLIFSTEELENECIQQQLNKDPFEAYDNNNALHFWERANVIHVKVLANDWHLIDITSEVDFKFMLENVLQFYELLYPFMNRELFSFQNKSRTECYSLLSRQMCDPSNRNKSYYMPPTRELSYPKAVLFQKFMTNVAQVGYIPCQSKNLNNNNKGVKNENESYSR